MSNREDLLKQLMALYQQPKKEYDESLERHITSIKDSYSNSVLGIGNADHIEQFDEYSFDNSTLNWYFWLALYNESWVFRRAIDKTSQDMIRPLISINGTQDYSKVYKVINNLKPELIDAVKWSKLFGGSIMVLLFKGITLDDMKNPISDYYKRLKNCDVIKSYVTDRWFGCSPSYDDIVSNLSNDDFGKPKYYDVMFADGTQYRIHHSWILRFENRTAPNMIKSGMLQGWGYAEGQHIIHELNRDEKLKASIQSLIDKSLIEIIKMPGMTGVFMGAEDKNDEQLKQRLEMVNWSRNFNSLTFLDKEDDYQQHQFSGLSGLSDIMDLNMKQVAAAVEMPNVLFGDLSNGFTSDDGALERYDDKILNDCDTYLRTPYTKLLKILFKIYSLESKDLSFVFNSSRIEQKNDKKLDDISKLIETCDRMVASGAMTSEQEAKTIREFINTGAVNFQFDDVNEKKIKEENKEKAKREEMGEDNDFGEMNFGSSQLKKPNRPQNKSIETEKRESNINTNEPQNEASIPQENTSNEPQEVNP